MTLPRVLSGVKNALETAELWWVGGLLTCEDSSVLDTPSPDGNSMVLT